MQDDCAQHKQSIISDLDAYLQDIYIYIIAGCDSGIISIRAHLTRKERLKHAHPMLPIMCAARERLRRRCQRLLQAPTATSLPALRAACHRAKAIFRKTYQSSQRRKRRDRGKLLKKMSHSEALQRMEKLTNPKHFAPRAAPASPADARPAAARFRSFLAHLLALKPNPLRCPPLVFDSAAATNYCAQNPRS